MCPKKVDVPTGYLTDSFSLFFSPSPFLTTICVYLRSKRSCHSSFIGLNLAPGSGILVFVEQQARKSSLDFTLKGRLTTSLANSRVFMSLASALFIESFTS
jgi:hypothetical protein